MISLYSSTRTDIKLKQWIFPGGEVGIKIDEEVIYTNDAYYIRIADMEQSHCGIIYQATNWVYTGSTISHDKAYIVDGKRVHPMTLRDSGITDPTRWARENNIQMVKPMPKHRYFQFVGSKSDKRYMRNKLNYPILDQYPKCDQNRYDDGDDLILRFN